MTRPDCSCAHASLCRVVQYPGQAHMASALRALAYLSGTIDQCLVYTRPGSDSHKHNRLWGWVDADYAGCKDTRKSRTGYVLMLNGATISWKSKRHASWSKRNGTTDMMADALTKSLAYPSFKIHRGTLLDKSSLHSRTSWTWA